MTEIDRELGVMSTKIAMLESDFTTLNSKLERIELKLASIDQKLSSADGSWKMLVGLATIAATLGGLVVAVLAWLWPR